MNPFLTINLERQSEGDRLFYRLAVVDEHDKIVKGSLREIEDYNEILVYAKCMFDDIRTAHTDRTIAVYIEQPHHLSSQGASYSLNEFVVQDKEIEKRRLYSELAEELGELCARVDNADLNVAFRQVVAKHKLAGDQENGFLRYLKDNSLVG
jgi:hypothetical protein